MKRNMLVKFSVCFFIFLAYWGIDVFLTNLVYSNYNSATVALPDISKRESVTSILTALVLNAITYKDPSLICGSQISAVFNDYYNLALQVEENMLSYKKSTNSLFADFQQSLSVMDSANFCNFKIGTTYAECESINNGIMQNGLRNYIFLYIQLILEIKNRICSGSLNITTAIDPSLAYNFMLYGIF